MALGLHEMMRVYLLLLLALGGQVGGEAPTVVVDTKTLGEIRGNVVTTSRGGDVYYSFLGLPYAQPPVGELRFKPPRPGLLSLRNVDESGGDASGRQSNVFNATRAAPLCPQFRYRSRDGLSHYPIVGQEDCLYVNVHSPKKAFDSMAPVMVWIHGGAHMGGSGNPNFYGPDNFIDAGVVVVTMNYRLGSLGWLNMEDGDENDGINGNLGLRDQILALKWVQSHIADFGGDPSAVTIFGESAGGIDVLCHFLSPASAGLFKRAIAQSGPLLDSPRLWFNQRPRHYGRSYVTMVGCDASERPSALLQCLQSVDLDKLMDASKSFERFTFMPSPWKPSVDGDYSKEPVLPMDYRALIEQGKFNKVPLMIGGNLDEGGIFMSQFLNDPKKFDQVQSDLDTLGPMIFFGTDGEVVSKENQAAMRRLMEFYKNEEEKDFFSVSNWRRVTDALTDLEFLSPIRATVRALLKQKMAQPVYYYNYRYQGELSLSSEFGYDNSLGSMGVNHADELFIQFTQPHLDAMKSEGDWIMTAKLTRLWTNFARGLAPDPKWDPVTDADNPKFIILDEKQLRLADSSTDQRSDSDLGKRLMFAEDLLASVRPLVGESRAREEL